MLLALLSMFCGSVALANPYALTLSKTSKRSTETFQFGTAVNPQGVSYLVDSKGFLVGGKAQLPVMGEIHYSRVPEYEWKRELLKMRAGGVTIVATYVFWIHHEETEGVFDWSGNRNLRRFIEVCKEIQMPLVLRIGPFCHGEVYQGGIPTWIIEKAAKDPKQYKVRSAAPGFLDVVKRLYANIAGQATGLFWKDGGPIVGVQIENECRGPWAYYQALKKIALEVGFDVPFYTRTGWPKLNGRATFGELLPLYGDYADGFWDRKLTDMPGDYPNAFAFRESRLSSVIATETFGTDQSTTMEKTDLAYPYLTCELGGGMMTSYHRRINIFDRDALALAVCKVGSGSNLPGYYMYHGGTNPSGKYHTMAETQNSKATNYNDMPYMSYDFQSPLGEMGQVNPSYHYTRCLHQMLADWGESLSDMDVIYPTTNNENGREDTALRWTVRTDGNAGFVFINNYQRMVDLTDKHNVQFDFTLLSGRHLVFPAKPMTVRNGVSFVLPFNLSCHGLLIDYATAQPLAQLNGTQKAIFFAAVDGVDVTLSIDGKIYTPKLNKPFVVKNPTGESVMLCVLDETKALSAYKVTSSNQDYLLLSPQANVYQDETGNLCIESWGTQRIAWKVYPEDKSLRSGKKRLTTQYPSLELQTEQKQEARGLREVKMGIQKVAAMPSDADFEQAAVWKLTGLENLTDHADNLFIRIHYKGDVARVYADGKLVEDNFWNGKPMLVRVADVQGKQIEIRILPLGKEYPIYLQAAQREVLSEASGSLLSLDNVELVERHTLQVPMNP